MTYIPPQHRSTAFNCPVCNAYATQYWSTKITYTYNVKLPNGVTTFEASPALTEFAFCTQCRYFSIWVNQLMVFPSTPNAPIATPDMPEDVRKDFNEARKIVNDSPRGACALLRLALQKLITHLGGEGKNLNDDIALLVKNGLPSYLQKLFDAIRVAGNYSVHPGELDMSDNQQLAVALFGFINSICESMITQRNKADTFYNLLPEKDKNNIEKRDSATV